MSLYSMAQCQHFDTCPVSPQYYPPWRFRLRAVHQRIEQAARAFVKVQLTKKEYSEAFSETLAAIGAIVKDDADEREFKGNPLCKIAYQEINKLLDDGWEYVGRLVPERVKRWTATQGQVPALLERIEAGIPPSETAEKGEELSPRPAELSAIMVAGWVYESFWEQEAESDRKFDYFTFMRLLLKGCEDAALRLAYNDRQKKGGSG